MQDWPQKSLIAHHARLVSKESLIAHRARLASKESYRTPRKTGLKRESYCTPCKTGLKRESYCTPCKTGLKRESYCTPCKTGLKRESYRTPYKTGLKRESYRTPYKTGLKRVLSYTTQDWSEKRVLSHTGHARLVWKESYSTPYWNVLLDPFFHTGRCTKILELSRMSFDVTDNYISKCEKLCQPVTSYNVLGGRERVKKQSIVDVLEIGESRENRVSSCIAMSRQLHRVTSGRTTHSTFFYISAKHMLPALKFV